MGAALSGWPPPPPGERDKRRTQKTKERYFFKQNPSLPTMPWSTSSHKFLPAVSSRNWRRRPNAHWTPRPRRLLQSRLHELFTDWRYSAERWTAAGTRKRLRYRLQFKCMHKLLWTRAAGLIVSIAPAPQIPQLTHACSFLACKGLTFKRGLFVTSLSIKVVQFDYFVSVIMS